MVFNFLGLTGSVVQNIFTGEDKFGLFSFFIPAMIIVAIVYGAITKLKLLENKKHVLIISLISGVIFGSFSFVVDCFSKFMIEFTIGLTLILAIYLMLGMVVIKDEKKQRLTLFTGLLSWTIIILIRQRTLQDCNIQIPSELITIFFYGFGVFTFIAAIVIIIMSGQKSTNSSKEKSKDGSKN